MNNKRYILIAIVSLILFSACQTQEQTFQTVTSQQPTEPSLPTRTQAVIPTETSTENILPTVTAVSTPTTVPRPTETPEPTRQSDFVRRLCPDLSMPLGLFSLAEPYIDHNTDPETVFTLYQVAEMEQNETATPPCTLYLSPGPMGKPQFAGHDLFWKSFDYDAETVTIWQYDPLNEPTNDVYPQHIPLLQTTTATSLGKAGLTDFVVSNDGELLVWSYTDPRVNEDNQLAYVQTIYAISPGDSPNQQPVSEIWFDIVPETNGRPHIIRLQRISAEKDRIYYSDEPIGLGRHWPDPAGQYSSLYSISTWGDAYPEHHYDCGQDYWCISDFSEALDLLVTIENNTNAIEIRKLSNGELISGIQVPEAYTFVRQALISPDGKIVFMGVALEGSIFDAPPTDVAIFYSNPPYKEDPEVVLSDIGLKNLLEWISPGQILADGNRLIGSQMEGVAIPSDLMLIDLATNSGVWLPLDARNFSNLVP